MSRTDTMKVGATVELREHAATDARVINEVHSTGWDPYDVWLTRVKQPRDAAANSALHGAASSTRSSSTLGARTRRTGLNGTGNSRIPLPASLMNDYGLNDPCMESNPA